MFKNGSGSQNGNGEGEKEKENAKVSIPQGKTRPLGVSRLTAQL